MSRTARHSQLWLAVRLPHLPLEIFGHSYNSAPPVIVSDGRRSDGRRVYRCNALALAEGVSQQMPLATAQSLVNGLVLERDVEREREAVQKMARACYKFTPHIEFYGEAADGNPSLLLEISRSLTLFHGIENLTTQLADALAHHPHHYYYGLAHTNKAAWLLSWQHHPIRAEDDRANFRQRLRQVSVDHLREFPEIIPALHKSGFQRLGDLMDQVEHGKSSAALSRRFGQPFSQYLEDILGGDSHSPQTQLFARPAETFTPAEHFQEHLQFDYPITDVEQLREPMRQLLDNLTDTLQKTQRQCHSIQWRLFDIYQNAQELTVNSDRIHSNAQLPLDLTMIQLEHTALEFAVDSLELRCRTTTAVDMSNHTLLNQQLSHHLREDSEKLFARLSARLGDRALSKLSYHDDALPENCQQTITVTEASNAHLPPQHLNAPRPSWLFNPPQPIQQDNRSLFWHGALQLIQGPERLQGHWWNTTAARDYFMALRQDFLRCWVYQDLQSRQWFVHGIFG